MKTTFTQSGRSLAVLSARGVLPLRGAWAFEAEIDALPEETPVKGLAASLTLGSRTFSGYVREVSTAAQKEGRARLILEAGTAGARAVVDAQGYESALLSTLVEGACLVGGETLAPFASTVVLGRYTRPEAPLSRVLSALCDAHGLEWRFTDAGAIQVAAETWPDASELDVLVMHEGAASAEVAPLAPSLSPGSLFQNRRIERVVYHLPEGGSLTASLYFEHTDGAGDMRGAFERAVRAAVRELVFAKRWPAVVAGQTEDGRVELVPDDSAVPSTPPVPPLYGLPGVRCVVPAGSRVGLVHDGADAARPRAEGWDQSAPSTLTEIEAGAIKLGAGASRGVVRQNDLGAGGTFVAVASPTLIYTSPDGLTSWQITGAVAGPSVNFSIVPVTGTPGALVTKATDASSKVVSE